MTIELRHVSVRRARRLLLDGVDWRVDDGEHWAILGPNGAGKTTLLQLAAARIHPTSGRATILGGTLGSFPVQRLHERIGLVESRLARRFQPSRPAGEVVLTGAAGTTALLEERLGPAERARAGELLELLGVAELAERPFGDCSDGERARLLLARALLPEPPLLLLDEPTAGLDLAGRELVLLALERLFAAPGAPTTVTVTHHVEELPTSTSHVLLLREGRVVAAGPVDRLLADGPLGETFGVPVRVARVGGRWLATADR